MTAPKVLRSISIFNDLNDTELEEFYSICEEKTYGPDTVLLREGDPADELYIIKAGFVNISRGSIHQETFMTVLGPGNYFGEAALFQEMKRTANVKATCDLELILVRRADFLEFIKNFPSAANRILYQMLKQIFVHLDQTSRELEFVRRGALSQEAVDKLMRVISV